MWANELFILEFMCECYSFLSAMEFCWKYVTLILRAPSTTMLLLFWKTKWKAVFSRRKNRKISRFVGEKVFNSAARNRWNYAGWTGRVREWITEQIIWSVMVNSTGKFFFTVFGLLPTICDPVVCTRTACRAIVNPMCQIDYRTKLSILFLFPGKSRPAAVCCHFQAAPGSEADCGIQAGLCSTEALRLPPGTRSGKCMVGFYLGSTSGVVTIVLSWKIVSVCSFIEVGSRQIGIIWKKKTIRHPPDDSTVV